MGLWQAQSNFSKGEIDPQLQGRIDLAIYYQGAETATNVRCIPQGGLKKRNGFQYLGTALGNGRIERFAFNIEQQYVFVFTDTKLQIYRDDVLLDPISGVDDFLTTPYTLAQLQEFDFIQSADTVIITHPDVAPRRIQRITDNNWTIDLLPYTTPPQFDFNDASSPAPTTEIQRADFDGAWTNGDTFKMSLEGILTDEITFNEFDLADTAAQMEFELQRLPNTGVTGVTVSVFDSGNEIFQINFADDSAKDWTLVAFQTVNVETPPARVTVSRVQTGSARAENAWSVTRGYPVSCTFHEGRLWFGGSRSLPSTIWGSRVNTIDFDAGRGRADEAISATLLTDQVNAVTNILSNRSLHVFTSGAEFAVTESPVTPENIAVIPQTNLGSKRVRPVIMEGATLYLQRTGRALYNFQFVDAVQANESQSLSVLAPHLIIDPVQMAVERGSSTNDANYVYIVSSNGDMTVFNSNSAEGVQAFTRFTTDGDIVSATVVNDIIYILVKRTSDGGDAYHLEREVLGTNTDANVVGNVGGSATLTGLDHLEGRTVKVKADGAVQPDQVVSGGAITIGRTAQVIEAGLEYKPLIKTMPFSTNLQNGPNAAQKKRLMRCAAHLFESNGVIINGERIADKTIAVNQFNAPEPITGYERIFLHGWSLEASITVTQEEPMDMTILSLDVEVKV